MLNGGHISSAMHSLTPFRSDNSSCSSSSESGNESDIYNYRNESMNAIESMTSNDDYSQPPPSYEDVVGDENYVPPPGAMVRHLERIGRRKHRKDAKARFIAYGYHSSKIYVCD